MRVLRERLECSESTVKRAIRDLRTLDAPLEYHPEQRGYYFAEADGARYELPGLWFNERELHGLLVVHQILAELHSDLLESALAPLRARIESLLANAAPGDEALHRRVRVPGIGARRVEPATFRAVSSALFRRRRLRVRYHARSTAVETVRTLSPQRLVHYRNNWYLDAWCHLRRALRSFALERIVVEKTATAGPPAREIDPVELDAKVGASYGIFTGNPRHRARIRFTPAAAAWVANENWHPEQRGTWSPAGYELQIPYHNPTELIMDILRHGENAEVLSPPKLRREVCKRLEAARKNYKT